MRKLFFTISLMIASSLVYAQTLTADMVKEIHDQVKTSFFEGCSNGLKGSAIEICRCLADKAQANLDDTALSKCNNDESGKDCVTKIVKDASIKATTQENIMDCKKKNEAPTGVNNGSTKNTQ